MKKKPPERKHRRSFRKLDLAMTLGYDTRSTDNKEQIGKLDYTKLKNLSHKENN